MDWRALTVIVCLFGFFKELRPSEAYLTPFLTGEWKNLTVEQVDNEIYPWWTYAYLLWLIPVFLLTDYLRYKPMLIVQALAYIGTWALLLWAQGLPAMIWVEVLFGLCTAADVGYYSYLYAIVSKEHYKKVASFTRASILGGKFVAYLAGQLLVSFDVMDYFQLNIISFSSVIVAFVIAVVLPRASYSEIFHRPKADDGVVVDDKDQFPADKAKTRLCHEQLKAGFIFMWKEVKTNYSSKTVIIWSLWWALASCGSFQVQNYIQNLWEVVSPHKTSGTIYNGAVEAVGTLVSALCVMIIGFLPIDWSVKGKGEFLMAGVCAFNGVCLFIIGRTDDIWVAYVLYDVFRATYLTVITIATAQIARSLKHQRYGFVFGCNTFVALLIETVLTVIVVDKVGLGVDVHTQVYGGYFGFMTILFLAVAAFNLYRQRRGSEKNITVTASKELKPDVQTSKFTSK